MKANEFTSAVHKLNELAISKIPDINERMALDATAMIKDRIINTGIKANGASLGRYSTNETPLFFYKNGKLQAPFSNPLNKAGEKFYLDVVKENNSRRKKNGGTGEPPRGISYEQWREANNRPTDHITLSFSGDTMRDIGVTKQIVSGTRIVTTVGPKNTKRRAGHQTTEQITKGLSERYGNFMEPNQEEIDALKIYLENQMAKIIHDSFR